MGSSGGEVGIALTPKYTKVVVCGQLAKEGKVRHGRPECLYREEIEEVGRSMEGLNPEGGRRECLEQESG